MTTRQVTVTTEVGIQARPATIFVDTAAEAKSDVLIKKLDSPEHPDAVEAKSILQVLVLDVRRGDTIEISCEDEDLLDRLEDLVTTDPQSGHGDDDTDLHAEDYD